MTSETCEMEAMRAIIRETTIELMDCGGTNPEATCEVVAENHPALFTTVGAGRVLALCREIHDLSDPAESARLQKRFLAFNAKYFSGRLGDFTVIAVYDAIKGSTEATSGWVDFTNRVIHIGLTQHRVAMPSMLLHHLAHASVAENDDTAELWLAEMRRLREMGAPV